MAEKVRVSEDNADDPELDKLLSGKLIRKVLSCDTAAALDSLDHFGRTLPQPREPKSPPQDDEVVDGLTNEMESCLKEATQLLSEQNPELMKEFEKLFSQSAAAATAESQQRQSSQLGNSIEETLEQTFQQMKQNTSNQVGVVNWDYMMRLVAVV